MDERAALLLTRLVEELRNARDAGLAGLAVRLGDLHAVELGFGLGLEAPELGTRPLDAEALRELIHAEMLNFHPNSGNEDPK